MKEKCILGLHIGITSVGWAVIGMDSHEILDGGVRMFSSADSSMNQVRKNYRGIRRNNRRQQNRLSSMNDYLSQNGYSKPNELLGDPIALRVKGLSKRLSTDELYVVLYHLTKYRGVSYLEDIRDGKTTDVIINNLKNIEHQYPCIIQKERLDKHGMFRGTHMFEGETFINTFTSGMYEKELLAILDCQKKYHDNLSEEFIEGFLEIYRRKREFYTGPGNELSRTNYGVYKTDGTTLDYLYDEFRGSCSVFNGKHGMDKELRASGGSYSAQYYNVLNDLCNIKVDGKKLTILQKKEVIELFRQYKLATTITKALKRLYGVESERVTGYRIDKNNKEENHSFQVYRSMRKDLAREGLDINKYTTHQLDAIADILTLNVETDAVIAHFKNKDRAEYQIIGRLSAKEIKAFVKLKQNRKDLFSKWSAFSYRLLEILVPEMLESGEEQYTCIKRLGIRSQGTICTKKIDYVGIVDEIYNPAVSRAVTQSIKIVNRLMKDYELAEIILEMPKDNSLEEEKSNISKLQKKNENQRMMALSFAGIKESQIDIRKDRRIIQKLKLYYQQRGRCLYSGRKINLQKLLDGTFDYEVDHIIPMSVSFDDSMANKVLVEAQQNRKKSNMTPYNYLNSSSDTWDYKEYKSFVLGLRRDRLINDTKKENLLMEQDIKKEEVVKGYINRNINDTRYASKVISNELNRFFTGNNKDVEVKVINGAITNQLCKATFEYKRNWKDEYQNFAFNAMLCCFAGLSLHHYHHKYVNIETGQILDKDTLEKLDNEEKAGYLLLSGWDIKNKILKYKQNIKISHKIDTKVNRLISDQTIYGTRKVDGYYYTVHKIKNIYDKKEYQRFQKKLINDKEKFLMFRYDTKTWQKLEEIMALYPNAKGSPFKEHLDKVGPLRKYAKKENGPVITELKYLGNRIGKGIDITHKYQGAKNRVVMESLKQFRGDVYYDTNECCYNIVPIRYADFSIMKNEYVLPESNYNKLLVSEGLLNEGQTIKNLESNGHEFCYSLYRNNIIGIEEMEDEEEVIKYYRYYGKNHSMKNRFEYKKIDTNGVSRKYITLSKRISKCYKYNVDILGNYYKVDKEKLKLRFHLDNHMTD